MDKVFKLIAEIDEDLLVIHELGVACQISSETISYDQDYFSKYESYKGTDVSKKIHDTRVGLVKKYHPGRILDIGVGNGDFIEAHGNCHGYDINPVAASWLKRERIYNENIELFDAFSMWDVIEHIPAPSEYFNRMKQGSYLFTSIPIFENLSDIRKSKHYKPGEHLYYFTEKGFLFYMSRNRFSLIDSNDNETKVGREGIMSFAFLKQ